MTVLLNNQTCYSILDSSLRINDLVKFAKEHGYKAIGVCETRNLFSTMPFYNACKKNSINPIIGVKTEVIINEQPFDYLVIAKNNDGFKELIKLSSYLCCDKKNIEFEQLLNISDNCYIINDVNKSYIYDLDYNKKYQELDDYIELVKQKDSWYFGIGPNSIAYSRLSNSNLFKYSNEIYRKCVVAASANMLMAEDLEATKILYCIKNNVRLEDVKNKTEGFTYLKTADEIKDDYPEIAIENSDAIANTINLDLSVFKSDLPDFKNKSDADSKAYLVQLATAGLNARLNGRKDRKYYERLNYELKIINEMGFNNYFLIIYDIVKTCRYNKIYVGPGRGSAVGSLVAYCLGITHIDPVKYGLFFERFLNPERITMPDIDIDIPDNKRAQVLSSIREKYGIEYVSNIISFGTLQAKAVIRDIAKVMGISDDRVEKITSNIVDSKASLMDLYANNPRFRQAINAYDNNKKLFELALKLDGLPRNVTMHAGGIVISRKKLTDVIPLVKSSEVYMTQFPKEYLEDMGLIKIDLLGLRNLNVIAAIVDSLPKKIDILKIPLDNKETYDLLANGDTTGIFQLEGSEMRKVIYKIHPTCFDDIILAMAIYRPGPKEAIPQFLENRAHPERIKYPDERIKGILEPTYGITLYQEQIMQLVQRVANFSLGKADILRRAISKKKAEEIDKLKKDFIDGAVKNDFSLKQATEIYENIYRFAEYGFNKSHAYAYGLIGYQLAYLKANYPLNFYCETLNSFEGNNVKITQYVYEMKSKGIKLLPPDINKSYYCYVIEGDSIRFPFSSIKNISKSRAKEIVKNRERVNGYKNYFEFYFNSVILKVTEKEKIGLIKSGCFDSFNLSHSSLIEDEAKIKNYINLCINSNTDPITIDYTIVSQPSLSTIRDKKNIIIEEMKEYLGIYLNGHPVEKFNDRRKGTLRSYEIEESQGKIKFVGMITDVKEITTKKNDRMAFIKASDEFGSVELALMPKQFYNYSNLCKKNAIVLVDGKKSDRNSVIINTLEVLKEQTNGENFNS